MSRHIPRFALAAPLILAVLASACSAAPSEAGAGTTTVPVDGGGSYTDVSPDVLDDMLAAKDFIFVNVHVPYEGEIAGTDLFGPYDQVDAWLGQLPADRSARIVLYCRSGSMSAIAARELVAAGYTDVWNLDGGMIAWQAQGYALAAT